MSILRAMNTGAAGLRSHGEAIGVVGDNIANANTFGFKKQRGLFEDMLGRSISGFNSMPEAGGGSRLAHIEQMWQQGALLTTEAPTDLAITGNGFFVVQGNVNGVDSNYYTRAGMFQKDANGTLVDPNGMKLQGYMMQANGTPSAQLSDITVDGYTIPAQTTSTATLSLNLDSNTAVPTTGWDPNNPSTGASGFPTEFTVYDSLGDAHSVSVYYRKESDNQWSWHAMMDGADIQGGAAGTPQELAVGYLTFNAANGSLESMRDAGNVPIESATINANLAGGASPLAFQLSFGQGTLQGGTGMEGTTQVASETHVNSIEADGYAAGSVAAVSVAEDGTVTGVFTNGQRRPLAKVALANFTAVDGLERVGQNLWTETQASGEALVNLAQSGGNGSIVAGALEQSNVDLGREFVDLIAYQRGFQANSKIITTADEMYGELVNLRR